MGGKTWPKSETMRGIYFSVRKEDRKLEKVSKEGDVYDSFKKALKEFKWHVQKI